MLNRLSIRNARRQFRDYLLYFITLICSVSFMYAFNTLIFSDSVKSLSELEILPFMITTASLLVILVMKWVISYMSAYILRRRSRELSIYMLSGITNAAIGRLLFQENLLIGFPAFLLGLPAGLLLSQLLETTLLGVFGQELTLKLRFSLPAVLLTLFYFSAMLLFTLLKSGRRLRGIRLYDLLYADQQNEQGPRGGASSRKIFLLSLLMLAAGLFIMLLRPLGKGYDALTGIILIVLFLFCFFQSVPGFLAGRLGERITWKYRKNRLTIFRGFTARIQSMNTVLGILSILFTLAVTFFGAGIAASKLADRCIELNVFDIMILNRNGGLDFTPMEKAVSRVSPIVKSHSYGIYTSQSRAFAKLWDNAVKASGWAGTFQYAEFQYDTYIKQSDYARLRNMLGYEDVELKDTCFYLHCVPALEKDFSAALTQTGTLNPAGVSLTAGGIFTEPFSQTESYGNGMDYVIVIPDRVADKMELLYSLCAILTKKPLTGRELRNLADSSEGLVLLNRNVVREVPSPSGRKIGTSLTGDAVYLSGRWVQREMLSQLYALLVCLFYLAVILEITGSAILATQLLGDADQRRRQARLLRRLGMEERIIEKNNRRQLTLIFLLPGIPALTIGGCLAYGAARWMQPGMLMLPVFLSDLWILHALGAAILFFVLLYLIYYAAAGILCRKQLR